MGTRYKTPVRHFLRLLLSPAAAVNGRSVEREEQDLGEIMRALAILAVAVGKCGTYLIVIADDLHQHMQDIVCEMQSPKL